MQQHHRRQHLWPRKNNHAQYCGEPPSKFASPTQQLQLWTNVSCDTTSILTATYPGSKHDATNNETTHGSTHGTLFANNTLATVASLCFGNAPAAPKPAYLFNAASLSYYNCSYKHTRHATTTTLWISILMVRGAQFV